MIPNPDRPGPENGQTIPKPEILAPKSKAEHWQTYQKDLSYDNLDSWYAKAQEVTRIIQRNKPKPHATRNATQQGKERGSFFPPCWLTSVISCGGGGREAWTNQIDDGGHRGHGEHGVDGQHGSGGGGDMYVV